MVSRIFAGALLFTGLMFCQTDRATITGTVTDPTGAAVAHAVVTATNAETNLKVETRGLRGGPIEWTKDNHFRTRQYYRVYRWDAGKGAIIQVKDWTSFEVK